MDLKDYREEVYNLINFLKKLKEGTSLGTLERVDAIADNILDDISKKFTNDNLEREVQETTQDRKAELEFKNTIFQNLITENLKAQKETRIITNINLLLIFIVVLCCSAFLKSAYDYTNNLTKSYLTLEQNKAYLYDNLISQNFENLDNAKKAIRVKRNIENNQVIYDSGLNALNLKQLDTIKSKIIVLDSLFNLKSYKYSNNSSVQPILYFHIFILIAFIIAIISVTIYLVKVLVNLVRYNSILADHYDALAGTFKLLHHKQYFSDELTLDKAYALMHPQRDKHLEFSSSLDLNTDEIVKQLKGALVEKKES